MKAPNKARQPTPGPFRVHLLVTISSFTYLDGTEARVGAAVALNHRAHTGTVQRVIESPAEIKSWNLDGPGLMIDTLYGGLVFYPKDSLTIDEIEFVSRAVA